MSITMIFGSLIAGKKDKPNLDNMVSNGPKHSTTRFDEVNSVYRQFFLSSVTFSTNKPEISAFLTIKNFIEKSNKNVLAEAHTRGLNTTDIKKYTY